VNVGNEGAFAPEGIDDNELPFQFLNEAIVLAGYKPGVDVWISLDPASSEFYKDGKYHFTCGNKDLDAAELLKFYEQVVQKYPIYSLEDAFAEDAWPDWAILMQKLGDRLKIIGDDLTVTSTVRLEKAIQEKAINAILIKLNQAGTVSETIEACKLARNSGFAVVPSHRGGGESNDAFLVDLAVAVGADCIKVGITRGERVAKYNRLMEIERLLKA
jgi:enolase